MATKKEIPPTGGTPLSKKTIKSGATKKETVKHAPRSPKGEVGKAPAKKPAAKKAPAKKAAAKKPVAKHAPRSPRPSVAPQERRGVGGAGKAPAKKPAAKKAPAKKAAAKKPVVAKKPEIKAEEPVVKEAPKKAGKYIYAVGRRKRAVAQVKLFPTGKGEITVNERPYDEYFAVYEYHEQLMEPLKAVGQANDVNISMKINGGGLRGQAEAARLGIARALLEVNPDFRQALKAARFLTCDARKKERKKPGLKKARRAPQWSKR